MSSSNAFLEAALDYAARGWPVFPCSPKTKRPLLPKDVDAEGNAIRGTGGLKKASTDADIIRGWWKKWPRAMIGLCTGHDRIFVLDFDPRIDDDGEVYTLDRLKADLEAQMGCALPISLAGLTRSDGVHLWLRWPDDGGSPITNRGNLPDHVDVRGKGGYIIAAPSVMEEGTRYRWLRGIGPDQADIADAPLALVEILRSPDTKKAGGQGKADRPAPARVSPVSGTAVSDAQRRWALSILDAEIAELVATPVGGGRHGGRNEGAFHAANVLGQIVGAGALSESMVRAALLDAILVFGSDHSGAVENGLERGKGNPRDLSNVGQRAGRGGDRSAPRQSAPAQPAPGPSLDDYGLPSFHAEGSAPDPSGGKGGEAEGGVSDGFGGGDRIRVPADPERDRICAFLPQTDLGNAERFRVRFGHLFRFCPDLGWFMWDGRRWALLTEEKDETPGEVMQAVFQTIRAIQNEALLVEESGNRDFLSADATDAERKAALDFIVKQTKTSITLFSDTIRAHAKSSEGSSRLYAIPKLVKDFRSTLIKAVLLDADRMAINVLNGTIRLVNDGNMLAVRLFPHNPGDLITKVADVIYDPDATCQTYDDFFLRVMPDEDDRRFLHQWAGLSSTGDITYHKMAFFWGKGRNGKSTWVDAVASLLGEYSMTIKFDTFLEQSNKRKGADATPDLARLPGVRFLRTSEPEKGAKLAEALIKEVTGGEKISARHLNKGFFDFLPSFKLTAQGNYQPKITGHDDGIWGRVRLVPWTVRIPDREIDQQLPAKLKRESSGIFNRMLAGLIDMKMNGLIESENVKKATEKYREASDQLGRFLRDCTIETDGARAKSSELFNVFTAWAKASGGGEWTPQGFSKAMEDRGYEKKTSNGVWWLDLEVTVDVADIEQGRFGAADGATGTVTPAPSGPSADDDNFVPEF